MPDRRQQWVIVDDNPDDRALICRELRRAMPDVEMVEVYDQAGLDQVWRDGTFTGVITDVHLRWTNGMDVLHACRESYGDRPVIMFTGTGSEELAVQAMKDGLTDYVLKSPQHYALLPKVVEHAVVQARLQAERRQADRERQQTEERLSLALLGAKSSVWDWDAKEARFLVEPQFFELLGETATPDGWVTESWIMDRLHPEDHDAVAVAFGHDPSDENPYIQLEMRLQSVDGAWRSLAVHGRVVERTADRRPRRGVGTWRDLTAQRLEEVRAARIFELSSDMVIVFDVDGYIVQVNPACSEVIGWSAADLVGRNWRTLCHPDDKELTEAAVAVMTESTPLVDFVNRWQCRDGTSAWISWNATPDQLSGYGYAVGRDVTEAHDRIDQMQRLATVIEHVGECILVTDTDGVITFVNPAFETISGYSREEAIGQKPSLLKSGMHVPDFYKNMWTTINSGRVWKGRFINRRRNGDIYTGESTISPVFNARGEIMSFVDVQRDITEVLRLEEHVHQSQKLESIGRMAGGVAHDFNNLLTVITGQAQLLQIRRRNDAELREVLDTVLSAAGRAVDLTRQLLAFSRQQPLVLQELDLGELVAGFSSILQRMIGEAIELHTHIAPDLWRVRADRTQIEQIIMNLALNARDAMDGGGSLDLYLENQKVSSEIVGPELDLAPGDYLCLRLVDSGHGIPADVLPKIFEPFFTTKDPNQGTGLGLATVYGIVRQHRGTVTVSSTPGAGCEFRVYLPRFTEVSDALSTETGTDIAMRGSESILVVEDDSAIRAVITEILRQHGYHILVAETVEDALAIGLGDSPVDLMLTDVVMPRMNGQQLYGAIREKRPELRVLYISGYLPAKEDDTPTAVFQRNFIQKPFTIQHLLTRVRHALDAR